MAEVAVLSLMADNRFEIFCGDKRMTMNKTIGIASAAGILGVPMRTLRRWASTGKLRCTRIGSRWYFDRIQIEKMKLSFPHNEGKSFSETLTIYEQDANSLMRSVAQEFQRKVSEFQPDVIVVEDRQAHRVISHYNLLDRGQTKKVVFRGQLYQLSNEERRKIGEGKKVLLVDEVAERARSLAELRKFFPGAIIQSLVLAVLAPARDKGLLEDLGLDFCVALQLSQYKRFCADLLDAITTGLPVDPDHLNLEVPMSEEQWKRLKELFPSMGMPYCLTSYLGSDEMEVWTLDDPVFFRLTDKVASELEFDGVVKLRFYRDNKAKKTTIVPIVFPTATFDPNNILAMVKELGWDLEAEALPPNIQDRELSEQAYCSYSLLTTILSADLLCQFIYWLYQRINPIPEFGEMVLGRDELFSEIHPQTAEYLYNTIKNRIKKSLPMGLFLNEFDQWNNCNPVIKVRPSPKGSTPSIFTMARVGRIAIKCLANELDKTYSKNKGLQGFFIPLKELISVMMEKDNRVTYEDVSHWFDFALDQSIVKTGERISVLSDNRVSVVRAYGLGENSGKKFDKNKPEGERYQRSKRDSQGGNDVGRCHSALFLTLTELTKSSKRKKGFGSFFINKILANLMHDWTTDCRPLRFQVRPFRFGPVVQLPQRHTRLNEHSSILSIAKDNPLFCFEPQQQGQAGFISAVPKPTNAQRQYMAEYLELSEESALIGWIRFYYEIVKKFDRGNFERPETLLQLAITRNESTAYEYLRIELSLWVDDFEDLIALLLAIDSSNPVSEELRDKIKTATDRLNLAPDEILRKGRLIESLPATINSLSSWANQEPGLRQLDLLLDKLKEGQLGLAAMKDSINSITKLVPLLKRLNILVKKVVSLFNIPIQVISNKDKVLSDITKEYSLLGVECTELGYAIDERNPSDACEKLRHLVNRINEKIIEILPEKAFETLKQHLETLLAEVNVELRNIVAFADSNCLVGYLDVLGIIEYSEQLIMEESVANVEEAIEYCCSPINEALNNFYEDNRANFVLAPMRSGGDGWIVALKNTSGQKFALQDAVRLMRAIAEKRPPRMPTLGLHIGKPSVGIGGPQGIASIIAYLCAEKSRVANYGDIVFTQETLDELIKGESKNIHPYERLTAKDGIDLPYVGKTTVYRMKY